MSKNRKSRVMDWWDMTEVRSSTSASNGAGSEDTRGLVEKRHPSQFSSKTRDLHEERRDTEMRQERGFLKLNENMTTRDESTTERGERRHVKERRSRRRDEPRHRDLEERSGSHRLSENSRRQQLEEGEILTYEESHDTSHLSPKQERQRKDTSRLQRALERAQSYVVDLNCQLTEESSELASLRLKYAELFLENLVLREQLLSNVTSAPTRASSEEKCTRCLGCDKNCALEEDARWGVFFCSTSTCPCCRDVTGEPCERCFCLADPTTRAPKRPFWPGPAL